MVRVGEKSVKLLVDTGTVHLVLTTVQSSNVSMDGCSKGNWTHCTLPWMTSQTVDWVQHSGTHSLLVMPDDHTVPN